MDVSIWIQLLAYGVGIAAAAVWLRSQIVRQSRDELQRLADTRGETIDDMREALIALQRQVDELRGQVRMMQQLKVSEIVDGVLEGLNKDLLRRFE